MQRLKRGDINRISPRHGRPTETFHPAPIAAARTTASPPAAQPQTDPRVARELEEVKKQLAAAQEKCTEINRTCDGLRAELAEGKSKEAALEKQLEGALEDLNSATAPAAAVNSVRVQEIQQVRSKGNTMRIDCTVEPTEGPLESTIAIYLTVEEGAKLAPKDEEDGDGQETTKPE